MSGSLHAASQSCTDRDTVATRRLYGMRRRAHGMAGGQHRASDDRRDECLNELSAGGRVRQIVGSGCSAGWWWDRGRLKARAKRLFLEDLQWRNENLGGLVTMALVEVNRRNLREASGTAGRGQGRGRASPRSACAIDTVRADACVCVSFRALPV